jgi:hypothetical protein
MGLIAQKTLMAWTEMASLDDTVDQKQALRQQAMALSRALRLGSESNPNSTEMREATRKIGDGASCVYSKYDLAEATCRSAELEKHTLGACDGVLALSQLIGTEHSNEPVDFELFYSHTGTSASSSSIPLFPRRARRLNRR